MTPSSYVPPEPPDKRVARAHALGIAARLTSKVISYRGHTLGEPQFCYRVPFHADCFWCTVFVSDTAYKFTINPKRETSGSADFCASLKREWHSLKILKLLPEVSMELGAAVFTGECREGQHVAKRLLAPGVKTLLARIELAPVRLFFINDTQVHFISELITPEHCAQQVHLLRDLLLLLNHEVHAKNNEVQT